MDFMRALRIGPLGLPFMLVLAGCQPQQPQPGPKGPPPVAPGATPELTSPPVIPAPASSGAQGGMIRPEGDRGLRTDVLVPVVPVVPPVPGVPGVPSVQVDEVQGHDTEAVRTMFVPAHRPVRECRPGSSGGLLRLRVTGDHGSARMSVDPNSSADAAMRRCVMEALSTIDLPDTLSQSSPSMSPSKGFSSVITVKW